MLLQKEPKLSRARQIPEWEEYDHEIALFARELQEKGLVKSRIAAQDTNVLANEAAKEGGKPSTIEGVTEETERASEGGGKAEPRDEL